MLLFELGKIFELIFGDKFGYFFELGRYDDAQIVWQVRADPMDVAEIIYVVVSEKK